MMTLIGAGGHAKVVWDALHALKITDIVVRDGNKEREGVPFMRTHIQTVEFPDFFEGFSFHVSIGRSDLRAALSQVGQEKGGVFTSVLHPAAQISQSAEIGPGTFAAAGAIIAACGRVGEGTIVNHGAIVDHDCSIGAFCHIAPGAVLGGQVRVGDHVLVGANATVLPGVSIGSFVTIGAGAIVSRSVDSGSTVIGTKAHEYKKV